MCFKITDLEQENVSNIQQQSKMQEVIKAFIQMLDIKEDESMTRVYSAIKPFKEEDDKQTIMIL